MAEATQEAYAFTNPDGVEVTTNSPSAAMRMRADGWEAVRTPDDDPTAPGTTPAPPPTELKGEALAAAVDEANAVGADIPSSASAAEKRAALADFHAGT